MTEQQPDIRPEDAGRVHDVEEARVMAEAGDFYRSLTANARDQVSRDLVGEERANDRASAMEPYGERQELVAQALYRNPNLKDESGNPLTLQRSRDSRVQTEDS